MQVPRKHAQADRHRWFECVACVLVLGLTTAAGCRLAGTQVVPSPLSYSEQEQAILQVAPLGTPQDEAVAKLNEIGIEGTFGRAGRSIYYCDIWNRDDGQRWHLNVALFFDRSGELYQARPADSEIRTGTAGETPSVE